MADLDAAIPLADAVLFEGYVLYPYRADDAKNAVRWQFGVLLPPAFAELDPSERAYASTELLLDGGDVELTVRVRFLHTCRRTVEGALPGGGFAPVAALDAGAATHLPGDEASVVEREIRLHLAAGASAAERRGFTVAAAETHEILGAAGDPSGRLTRSWAAIRLRLHVEVTPLPGPYGTRRVRLRVDNNTPCAAPPLAPQVSRADALAHALVATHLLAGVDGGRFLSLLDPPEWARGYAGDGRHAGLFPVLAGESLAGEADDVVLAAPIILYDHASVAPESAVAFCDGTEMDEMLTLRALTLTDDEKRRARGSDPRAAALMDHVEHLPDGLLDRLHGAIRSMTAVAGRPDDPIAAPATPWWDPGQDAAVDPDTDEILVAGRSLRRGVAVRLRPGAKRADAQDMFLEGRLAHVEAVLRDVDGATHLAVALDDLVEDGYQPHGRFLYFAPEEVEPV